MTKTRGKDIGPQISLDPDVLGFIGAFFFGTLVMAFGFWRGSDGFTVAIRTGLTFVVTYGAIFLLVRLVLISILAEQPKKQTGLLSKENESGEAESEESASDVKEEKPE